MLGVKYYFDGKTCSDVPDWVAMTQDDCDDANSSCKKEKAGNNVYNVSATCTDDRFDYAVEAYGSTAFVFVERYTETACHDLFTATAFPASSECQTFNKNGESTSQVTYDGTTGAVSINVYNSTDCKTNLSRTLSATSNEVSTRDTTHCINGIYKIYTSYSLNDPSTSGSASESSSGSAAESSSGSTFATVGTKSEDSSIGTGAIIGIAVAVLVAVALIVGGFLWYRRRIKATGDSDKLGDDYTRATSPVGQQSIDTVTTDFSNSIGLGPQSLASLWDDEIIATSRIPREKVLVQQLINRGGYGEVYYGLYNGQRVALKMLLPEFRKSIRHVNEFLDEVRLMALLDHPRIVHFVGIAWDSLSDLCAVLEYMEGGDLRALLASYEAQGHELGFDRSKVTIALHVAHALTYLHSLDPPVLHRDLKSKNILLTSDLQAKVTDFGISREGSDKTMTAGVGTSLWMAPEVMMGQRYDGKADIFSLGVVLSELDLHTLPYSYAKENSNSGRKIPDTAILQMVALGKLRVEFSSEALESMVALGNACVAVDPTERPTAAEALYRLQRILREDL